MKTNFFIKVAVSAKKDKFFTNSLVFFIGSLIASAGNYLFHFLMARMLPIESYGELQSLLAISVVSAIPIGALSVVLVKYTAHFKAREHIGKIYGLFSFFTKKIFIVAVVFSALFFVLKGHIADFLNLSSVLPIAILGVSFLPAFLATVNNGVIQGLQKFKSASVIGVVGVVFKILFAVLLVKIGFGINGAVGSLVLSGFIGYFIAFLPLKFLFGKERTEVEKKEIFRYFVPTFLTLLFISLLYNIDIILVKHFLSPYTAGEYGALTVIGHIIFFLTGPIIGVMFPMVAAAHSRDIDSRAVFRKTVFSVSLLGAGSLAFYFLFPNFIIKLLVGVKFLAINRLLGWFGLAMFLFSLINLFARYFLSLHKTKFFFLVGIGVLLQSILISIWHSSLEQIVWIMNITMFSVLALLFGYYLKTKKRYVLTGL